jgi:dienelactone hydrolase
MDDRFTQLPRSLQAVSKKMMIADRVPALITHPSFQNGYGSDIEKIPAVIWMHGRTVNKELDPGRYQRWIRSGIGAVAIDLPGHGERYIEEYQSGSKTLDLIKQACREIDIVLDHISTLGLFDMERVAIGGMSAGGMVTLCRLCSDHPFIGACVEGTTGNLHDLYFPEIGSANSTSPFRHRQEDVDEIDPMQRLEGFRPLPLLGLHNEGDETIAISTQRLFLSRLREHYIEQSADPDLIKFHVFTDSGAPAEHAGFGRYANEAKNMQLEFLKNLFGMNS